MERPRGVMGLREAIFGRRKPDAAAGGLFSLHGASVEMGEFGLKFTGQAAVCHRAIDAREFGQVTADLLGLLKALFSGLLSEENALERWYPIVDLTV